MNLDVRLHKVQRVELTKSRAKNELRKTTSKKCLMISIWKKKKNKGDILKFVDAEVTAGMREKEINHMEWIDRE